MKFKNKCMSEEDDLVDCPVTHLSVLNALWRKESRCKPELSKTKNFIRVILDSSLLSRQH
jgi:hypothetical protein